MKVQCKGHQEELHVLEESESYYIVLRARPGAIPFALAKTEAALIPDKQWRNVTAECETVSGGVVLHGGRSIICRPDEFRIRKVAVDEFKTMLGPHSPLCERYDVLIVEKLEEQL